jgi:membrane associated rhomboid family serine protease
MDQLLSKNLKSIPVTSFIAVSLIIIFSLYFTTIVKTIPCGKDILSIFFGNFVHTDPYHILANLYALYALSRVEKKIGTKQFFGLVVFLLIFNTLFETGLRYINKDLSCSIGFSGVLFGVMTWELTSRKEIDFYIVSAIVAMVLLPSMKNPNVSLSGHLTGAISGVIGGILWRKFMSNNKMLN